MPLQPANMRFRKAVLGFYAWLGALVFAAGAPLVAVNLLHAGTLVARIAAVAIGTSGWLPMLAVTAHVIRVGDEFQRRIHLVAIACAFASALVILTLLDMLTRARFIAEPSLSALWVIFAVTWAVWIFAINYWFEHRA